MSYNPNDKDKWGLMTTIATIFGIILVIVSINDFLFFRIENEYVLALMLLYIVGCLSGVLGHNVLYGVVSASIVFAACFVMNQYGLIGGGDVKLFVPLLLFAEDNIASFFLGMSIGGLILGVVYYVAHRKIFFFRRKVVLVLCLLKKNRKKMKLLNFVLLSLSRINRKAVAFSRYRGDAMKQEIPYGIALACGGFSLLLDWCRW